MHVISSAVRNVNRVIVGRDRYPVGTPIELSGEVLAAIEASPGMSVTEVAAEHDADPGADHDLTGGN